MLDHMYLWDLHPLSDALLPNEGSAVPFWSLLIAASQKKGQMCFQLNEGLRPPPLCRAGVVVRGLLKGATVCAVCGVRFAVRTAVAASQSSHGGAHSSSFRLAAVDWPTDGLSAVGHRGLRSVFRWFTPLRSPDVLRDLKRFRVVRRMSA